MIEWFNSNQVCGVLSITSVIISVAAICVSINVLRKQNKIVLFNQKFVVYKSLEEHFNSPMIFQKAVSTFLYPNVGLKSNDPMYKGMNGIIKKAKLLFSKNLNEKLSLLGAKYAEIRSLDNRISLYFKLLKEESNYQEIRPSFEKYLIKRSPENDKSFEEFCNNNKINTTGTVKENKHEPVVYNFYNLYTKQTVLCQEIIVLQESILKAMLAEIKPL